MNTSFPEQAMPESLMTRTSVIHGQTVQWIQVDTLTGGDLLEVRTEGNTYIIAVCGTQRGLLTSSNKEVQSGEILLLGSWMEDGTPCWGTIRKGAGLLFSKPQENGTATKTSVVVDLFLRKYVKSPPAYTSSPATRPVDKPAVPTQPKTAGVGPIKVGGTGGVAIPKPSVAGSISSLKTPINLPKTPTLKPRP